MLVNGKERLARYSVEHVDVALLADLRHCIDVFAISMQREERRLRGKIAIPDVVMHALEMPQQLAGGGVEGKQRVCVEIVTDAVAAVKVHDRRAGGDIDDA